MNSEFIQFVVGAFVTASVLFLLISWVTARSIPPKANLAAKKQPHGDGQEAPAAPARKWSDLCPNSTIQVLALDSIIARKTAWHYQANGVMWGPSVTYSNISNSFVTEFGDKYAEKGDENPKQLTP